MKNRSSIFLMVLGVLLLLGAAGLVVYNSLEDQQAGARSAEALDQVADYVQSHRTSDWQEETLPAPTLQEIREMPVAQIDGKSYVGTIAIPALDIELPVIADWSYDGLKTAPCRYYGSVYTKDMVLCGHSFARHFGYLSRLKSGDTVTFTCMDGEVFRYEVAAVEVLEPTAVEEMTAGVYPLSLFTCTKDSQSRITVRCEAAE